MVCVLRVRTPSPLYNTYLIVTITIRRFYYFNSPRNQRSEQLCLPSGYRAGGGSPGQENLSDTAQAGIATTAPQWAADQVSQEAEKQALLRPGVQLMP